MTTKSLDDGLFSPTPVWLRLQRCIALDGTNPVLHRTKAFGRDRGATYNTSTK